MNDTPSGGDRPAAGMRAVAVREPSGPSGRLSRLAGVLLPPLEPGGMLRLHVDGTGRVVALSPPGTWKVAHERGMAERHRDRRRQTCPEGRPIYRHNELPAAQLATRTMLRHLRRRPADGQEPVASYMLHRAYAPLYAVADSVPLPKLPPAREAAWKAARTCARCSATAVRPLALGRDGERYCPDCQEPAAAAWWRSLRNAGRLAAAAWADQVHTAARRSGDIALVYLGYPTSALSQTIVAETWDGQVLLAATVCDSAGFFREGRDTRPADLADAFRQLAAYRLITWRGDQHWFDRLQDTMRPHAGDLGLVFADGDAAGRHWDEWRAERNPSLIEPYPYTRAAGLDLHQQSPPSSSPHEVLAHIRGVVAAMAGGRCYWWRATCTDTECGLSPWFGTSTAADRWAGRHHDETGHIISHTTEPGADPAP